jgi:hypothetical protein
MKDSDLYRAGAIGAAFSPAGASSGNTLDARIEHNSVKNASVFGIWVNGGIGSFDGDGAKVADDNKVNAIVTDNTVTGTLFGEGIHLEAGGSGEANDNEVEVKVRKNTVCGSAAADIHAIGGLLGNPFLIDNTGTGNALEGEISKNTASTVVVENGVTMRRARSLMAFNKKTLVNASAAKQSLPETQIASSLTLLLRTCLSFPNGSSPRVVPNRSSSLRTRLPTLPFMSGSVVRILISARATKTISGLTGDPACSPGRLRERREKIVTPSPWSCISRNQLPMPSLCFC